MSKPGPGSAAAGGSGPTAAAILAAAQKQKSLLQRLDNDISQIVDNFSTLISISRVSYWYSESRFCFLRLPFFVHSF